MYCKKCGNPLAEDEKFCGKCGTAVSAEEQTKKGNIVKSVLQKLNLVPFGGIVEKEQRSLFAKKIGLGVLFLFQIIFWLAKTIVLYIPLTGNEKDGLPFSIYDLCVNGQLVGSLFAGSGLEAGEAVNSIFSVLGFFFYTAVILLGISAALSFWSVVQIKANTRRFLTFQIVSTIYSFVSYLGVFLILKLGTALINSGVNLEAISFHLSFGGWISILIVVLTFVLIRSASRELKNQELVTMQAQMQAQKEEV
ncbi:MAG: zinc ribbon domain-containing protein [Clostridia bacterium]|nr:zinc ribbon domain-containing protein [Clostridia bacterium]